MVNFETVLKHGYKMKKTNIDNYEYDKDLSNHNQQVYYDKINKSLLYNVNGTHNLYDVGTDIYLGIGKLKDTERYRQADRTLFNAKQKYNPQKTILTGHSLGGSIAGYIAKPEDDVYTLDKGATAFQKVKKEEHAYRSKGDVVSLLNANSKHMSTLEKPSSLSNTLISSALYTTNPFLGFGYNALSSHNVENIKDKNILI
jgi:hypothetical protein